MAGAALGCLFLLLLPGIQATSYSGYVLIQTRASTQSQLSGIIQLLNNEIQQDKVDVWSLPREVGKAVMFALSESELPSIEAWFDDAGIEYEIRGNLQSLVENEAVIEASSRSRGRRTGLDLTAYNDHEQMNVFLRDMESQCDICQTLGIGESYEGREMIVLKIGRFSRGKPAIWIDAGIHAREWIAPATALQIIHRFVSGYIEGDPDVMWLLDNFVWFILPSANPDGYTYSRETERFWRKTRRPNSVSDCVGTDPNRNWNFHWAEAGTNPDPCHETFPGPTPFSEVETRNIRDFLLKRKSDFLVYLSFHSYGQFWLYPWGFDSSLPEDWEEIHRVGQRAVDKIREVSGTEYTLGSSTNVLYAAAGASDDWAKGVANIKYSYCVELRDDGNSGFLLPPEQIVPTAEEIWPAIVEMSHAVREYVDGDI